MNAPIVNGVCLSVIPSGVYCDRGETGPHLDHEAGWMRWTDEEGTLDPRGLPKRPPRTCLDGCRWLGTNGIGCSRSVSGVLYWQNENGAEGHGYAWDPASVRPGALPCPGFERVSS